MRGLRTNRCNSVRRTKVASLKYHAPARSKVIIMWHLIRMSVNQPIGPRCPSALCPKGSTPKVPNPISSGTPLDGPIGSELSAFNLTLRYSLSFPQPLLRPHCLSVTPRLPSSFFLETGGCWTCTDSPCLCGVVYSHSLGSGPPAIRR